MEKEEELRSKLASALREKGYELYSLRLKQNPATLEVVIDREEPISLENIVEASGLVDAIVDPIDPFDGPYTLDVSSLGAEKPIPVEKLERALGKKCYLHLSHPFEGENELTGLVEDVTEESVKLVLIFKGKKKKVELERRYIDRAHLAV